MKNPFISPAFLLGFVLLFAPCLKAATLTWDPTGGGASDGAGAWLTAGDWWDGVSNVNWTSGDNAIFGNGGTGGAVGLASPTTIGSITFNSFSGTYTLGTAGQAITLNNGITMNAGAGAATIISPITLGAAQSWTNNDDSLLTVGTGAITNGGFLLTVGGSGNTSISSVIGGTGGLTKTGAGTLTLSGTNTFSGQLTVESGTLSIGSINGASANGALGNSALAVILGSSGNTGTLRYTGNSTGNINKVFSLAAGGTSQFDVTSVASNLTLSGNNTGTGNLIKTGAGVLTLSGNNGAYGSITINAGALQLGYGGTGGALNTGSAISIGAGAVFAINRSNAVTQGTTFSGAALSGDGAFSQYGSGTTTLNVANTYKGGTTISGGTLSIAAANHLGHADSNLIFNGGTLQITGTALTSFTDLGRTVVFNDSKVVRLDINNVSNTFTLDQALPTAGVALSGAGTVAFQNSVSALTLNIASGSLTYSGGGIGDGTDPRSITKIGAGTQILQGNNGYTGATNINAGTLTLSGAAGALASTSIALNGGNLTLDNATNLGTRISNSATIAVNGNSALTFTHAGTVGVDYSETIDTLSLQSGFLTYTGSQANATGPRSSNLQFNTLSRSGTATVNFAGTGLGSNVRNTIKFGAGVSDGTDLGPWAVVSGADFASYSTANGIVAATSSTLAVNSNSSTTNFNTTAGSITFDAATNPSLKTLLVTGGTIRTTALNGNTLSVGGISSTGAVHVISGTGAVQALNAGDALYVNVGANSLTFSSTIQNVGAGATASALVKYGAGTLTLGGTNTYTGGTVINAGTVSYSANANLGASGSRNVTFAGTGTLSGFNGTLDQLTVNAGAVATLSNTTTVTTTTGLGNIIFGSSANLGNASNFHGSLLVQTGTSGNIQFSSLGDAAGSGNLQYGGKAGDGNQAITMTLSGNTGPLTLNNRRVEFIAAPLNWAARYPTLKNDNASPSNKFVINTNLLNNTDRSVSFRLGGSNAGDNEFAGVIGDSTFGYMYDGVFSGNNMAANGIVNMEKVDAGRWILSANNTYTGTTTITAGTLEVTNLANGGIASSIGMSTNEAGNLILNGGTLRYAGEAGSTDRLFSLQGSSTLDSSGTGAINFTNTGAMGFNGGTAAKTLTLTGTNTGNNTIAAVIGNNTAATAITKTGIGTWVLSGANTNTGATAISGGGTLVLNFGTQDDSKLSNSAALTLSNGAGNIILRGGTHTESVGSLTIGAGGGHTSMTRDGGSAKIALGAITRNQNAYTTVSLSGDGIATTTSTNVNGILSGGITVGSNWAKNDGSGNIVALSSGDYTGLPSGTGAVVATTNYELTGSLNRGANTLINSLRIVGNDVDQILNMGSFNLQPSMLANAAGALKDASKYVGDSATGGILYAGGGNNNYTITGSGSISAQNSGQELIIHTSQGNLNLDMIVATGSNGLVKAGAGTLVLSKAAVYTGTTHVNQGTVRLTNATGAGTTGAITVHNGGALELSNSISVGAKALTLTGTGIFNGGALRNQSGSNSYAGAITIGTGGSRISSDSGSMTLTGGVVTSLFNDVTFGGAGNSTVSTAAISGAGSLMKDGAGTLSLSGTNTYTGGTRVNGGILEVSGTGSINTSSDIFVTAGEFRYGSSTGLTRNVTVDGGTFRYNSSTPYSGALTFTSGSVAGTNLSNFTLTIGEGQSISPGNSPGTMSVASQTWAGGGGYLWEINDATGTAGEDPGWDLLSGTGTLDITATSSNPFNILLTTLTLANAEGIMSNFDNKENYNWLIADFGSEITTFDASYFNLDTSGFANPLDPQGAFGIVRGDSVGGDNSQIYLTYTVIPEPKAALLGGLGILLLLRRRR